MAWQNICMRASWSSVFDQQMDDERQRYRFHDLFREALRARLQASQPQLVPLLHLRAARFYGAVGERREAIAHALAAPDYSFAASLIEGARTSETRLRRIAKAVETLREGRI